MTIEAVNVPIPSDVLDKLNPYKADLEILSVEEIDPFHNSLHVQQLKQFASWIEPAFDVNSVDKKRLNRGIEIHDQGYAFVKRGLLTPDQHHFGSAYLALEIDKDPNLAHGVLMHTEDAFSNDEELWVHILRDVDRVDRMGWYGLLMESYYMGFRHPLLTNESAKQQTIFGENIGVDPFRDPRHPINETKIETQIFWEDFRGPAERMVGSDYEDGLKQFCIRNVFPFLKENGQVREMIDRLWYWMLRFDGVEEYVNPDMGDVIWTIDPVMDVTDYKYKFKLNNTEEAMFMLSRTLKDESE